MERCSEDGYLVQPIPPSVSAEDDTQHSLAGQWVGLLPASELGILSQSHITRLMSQLFDITVFNHMIQSSARNLILGIYRW